jgi:hypothetical protein
LPEGATSTYQGSLGVSMYSINSADIGHSMMITKMPSVPGIDSTSLLKVMFRYFCTGDESTGSNRGETIAGKSGSGRF